MDAEVLQSLKEKEASLEKEIEERGRVLCGQNIDLYPIYDGVFSLEQYFSTSPRIMWILKEPYDEMENGIPAGGGWSIPKDLFTKEDDWKNKSRQLIIYTLFGLYNNISYARMDYIRNNPSMADVMKTIAYINVGKMPAYIVSNDAEMFKHFEEWEDIITKQIELYDPEIIIFGGTFKYFYQNNFFPDLSQLELNNNGQGPLRGAYFSGSRMLLDACHPSARMSLKKMEDYVNGIISTIHKYYKHP